MPHFCLHSRSESESLRHARLSHNKKGERRAANSTCCAACACMLQPAGCCLTWYSTWTLKCPPLFLTSCSGAERTGREFDRCKLLRRSSGAWCSEAADGANALAVETRGAVALALLAPLEKCAALMRGGARVMMTSNSLWLRISVSVTAVSGGPRISFLTLSSAYPCRRPTRTESTALTMSDGRTLPDLKAGPSLTTSSTCNEFPYPRGKGRGQQACAASEQEQARGQRPSRQSQPNGDRSANCRSATSKKCKAWVGGGRDVRTPRGIRRCLSAAGRCRTAWTCPHNDIFSFSRSSCKDLRSRLTLPTCRKVF